MTSPRAIKDLTLQAVNLLEMSHLSARPDASRFPTTGATSSDGMPLQHLEFTTFCKSRKVTNALVLANLVSWFALESKMPTLLVTTTCTPVVFAFSLLLWRAGIHPREVAKLPCTHTHFARLTAAAGEVARAPLLVMSSTTVAISWRAVLTLAGSHRNRRVITDAATEVIPQLKKLSCRLGLPITIDSTTRSPPQGRQPRQSSKVVEHKATMSIDEIELKLRRVFGVARCNSYREIYQEAKNDRYRWAACESMAGFAYTRYDCIPEIAHAAARRILTEPLEKAEAA